MKNFDCNHLFSGGNGMFIEYHDIVRPVYLFVILSLILSPDKYGLPIDILSPFSVYSLTEWYRNRRYQNPIMSIDYEHVISPEQAKEFVSLYLNKDQSIYSLAPQLNICAMLSLYNKQHMAFPVYFYSEEYEEGIERDIKQLFSAINGKYLYGDLSKNLKRCDQNFTYIFSNVATCRSALKSLDKSFAHVLLAEDYRYNFKTTRKELRCDLEELIRDLQYVRFGFTRSCENIVLVKGLINSLTNRGDLQNAAIVGTEAR